MKTKFEKCEDIWIKLFIQREKRKPNLNERWSYRYGYIAGETE